jgi:hypothetical protein
MLAAWITLAHFSVSVAMSLPKSAASTAVPLRGAESLSTSRQLASGNATPLYLDHMCSLAGLSIKLLAPFLAGLNILYRRSNSAARVACSARIASRQPSTEAGGAAGAGGSGKPSARCSGSVIMAKPPSDKLSGKTLFGHALTAPCAPTSSSGRRACSASRTSVAIQFAKPRACNSGSGPGCGEWRSYRSQRRGAADRRR